MLGLRERETVSTELPNWRDAADYLERLTAETQAHAHATTLNDNYVRCSRECNAGSEIIRLPPAGHPIHRLQYESVEADKVAKLATRAREQAEVQAKARVQRAGEDAKRAGWPPVEEALDQLMVALNTFQAVQQRVHGSTDVKPVEISHAVGLNEGDLQTFILAVRRELGLGR